MSKSALSLSIKFALLVVALIIIPEMAMAYDSRIGDVMCRAALVFRGNAGRGIATIGICIIGVGALLGKVSWGLAIIVGTGVGALFGSVELLGLIGGVAGC